MLAYVLASLWRSKATKSSYSNEHTSYRPPELASTFRLTQHCYSKNGASLKNSKASQWYHLALSSDAMRTMQFWLDLARASLKIFLLHRKLFPNIPLQPLLAGADSFEDTFRCAVPTTSRFCTKLRSKQGASSDWVKRCLESVKNCLQLNCKTGRLFTEI